MSTKILLLLYLKDPNFDPDRPNAMNFGSLGGFVNYDC